MFIMAILLAGIFPPMAQNPYTALEGWVQWPKKPGITASPCFLLSHHSAPTGRLMGMSRPRPKK
jgi:hypothetical protein